MTSKIFKNTLKHLKNVHIILCAMSCVPEVVDYFGESPLFNQHKEPFSRLNARSFLDVREPWNLWPASISIVECFVLLVVIGSIYLNSVSDQAAYFMNLGYVYISFRFVQVPLSIQSFVNKSVQNILNILVGKNCWILTICSCFGYKLLIVLTKCSTSLVTAWVSV